MFPVKVKVKRPCVDVYLPVDNMNKKLLGKLVWFFGDISSSSPHDLSPPRGGYKLIRYEFKTVQRRQLLLDTLSQYDDSVVLYEAGERMRTELVDDLDRRFTK